MLLVEFNKFIKLTTRLLILLLLVFLAKAQDVVPMTNNDGLGGPARISCNAAHSAPCARTNSQWLSTSTANALAARLRQQGDDDVWSAVMAGTYNMETGFYPFVFDMNTTRCVAHGANFDLVGKTLSEIFHDAGIGFSKTDNLFHRFVQASKNPTGDWVQYLWTDGGTIVSKLAFVTNVTDRYLLGVGYENQPLPLDLPCSSKFDSWCSVTNARSLVGRAQFLLYQAETVSQFEDAVFDLSFDQEQFQIPGGFYIFMYGYDGRLKSHALLHDHFGDTLSEIWVHNNLGTQEEGGRLHEQFILAAEGESGGWVRYQWRDGPEDESYTKVAFIAKIDFQGELFYLGVGFNFERQAVYSGDYAPCSDDYNLPCAFQTSLQLSSHALSYAISSINAPPYTWNYISTQPDFRQGDFYLYIYNFNMTCVAHGQVPEYAGLTLDEVYARNQIPLNASLLHDKFRQAATEGGGWVSYDWLVPGVADSEFQKIAYLFRINMGNDSFYGGIGFNHRRAPLQIESEIGTRKNGNPIMCSRDYYLACSEANVRALLGQSLAELTLATSEAQLAADTEENKRKMHHVLSGITAQDPRFAVNDFFVSVFSENNVPLCELDDGTGCCISHGGNASHVGKTWQQILDHEQVTSIRGINLHQQLILQSNSQTNIQGSGVFEYPWSGEFGDARTKRAVVSKFKSGDVSFYVLAEYFKTPQPPSCDSCPADMECTEASQSFCVDKPEPPPNFVPWISALIILFVVGLAGIFWYKRKNWLKRQALAEKIKEMEDQIKGMVEIIHDTGAQFHSAESYRDKFGVAGIGALPNNNTPKTEFFWCWEEDLAQVHKHASSQVLSDTNFVRYLSEISNQIEHAYQLWKEGKGFQEYRVDLTNKIEKVNNAHTGSHYEIDFEAMTQKNSTSQYERAVRREEDTVAPLLDPSIADSLPPLPADIDFGEDGEDFLPTFRGQVIQVSKEHSNKEWLYGSVLYDPLLADATAGDSNTKSSGLDAILSNALHDRPVSGWFPKKLCTTANAKVMQNLMTSLGGEGIEKLQPPPNWTSSDKDGLFIVSEGSKEYQEVCSFFLSALFGQRKNVTVVQLERVQAKPLWQSYAVKRETMKTRNANHQHHGDNIERKWLFHGTKMDVIPKIVNQGFNRAFAGRNAVVYGKGSYFARDASYSSHRAYSEPDEKGVQRMFLCRVAVGDWCRGTCGQLTPDTKPGSCFELFDSTVDNVSNPSIFVVYHDAQAYPEYLVSFTRDD